MFRRESFTLSVKLLNPKLRYVVNDKSHLALYALPDIYVLVMHNIKLSSKRQADKFLTYSVVGFNVGDKVLVRNHTRDTWNPKYNVAYQVVQEMGRQVELMDESGKTH